MLSDLTYFYMMQIDFFSFFCTADETNISKTNERNLWNLYLFHRKISQNISWIHWCESQATTAAHDVSSRTNLHTRFFFLFCKQWNWHQTADLCWPGCSSCRECCSYLALRWSDGRGTIFLTIGFCFKWGEGVGVVRRCRWFICKSRASWRSQDTFTSVFFFAANLLKGGKKEKCTTTPTTTPTNATTSSSNSRFKTFWS